MDKQKYDKSLTLIAKSSFIVFIGVALSKIFSYFYRVLAARYYGPEEYGLFSLALMVSGWFIAFGALGLSDGLLRFIPYYKGKNQPERVKYIFRYVLKISIFLSLFLGIVLYFSSDLISNGVFNSSNLSAYLKIFSFIIPLSVVANVFMTSLRANKFIKEYSLTFNILQNSFKLVFLILFVFLSLSASKALSISYVGGLFVMLLFSYLFCRKNVPWIFNPSKIEKSKRKESSSEIIKYSLPLLFSGIIIVIFFWVDSFFLGYFKNAYVVGIYNAAVPIAGLLLIMPELFIQLFFPMINEEYSKGNKRLISKLSKHVAKWIFLVNFPLFLILLIFPGAVINLIFGQDYLTAIISLRILVFSSLLTSVFLISNNLVSMIGKTKLVLINTIIGTVLNGILNYFLIPLDRIMYLDNSLGLIGAALATAISTIVMYSLFYLQARKYAGISCIEKKMIRLFFAGLVSLFFLIFVKQFFSLDSVIIVGILAGFFALFYVFLVLLSKSLVKEDYEIIKKTYSRVKSISMLNN